MRLIRPSAEIWAQGPGISGVYKQIERCARVCYKSEDKIGEGTAEKMVEMLTKRGHTAMLEHGTVYLQKTGIKQEVIDWVEKYALHPYARVVFNEGVRVDKGIVKTVYVTTNYRVLYETGWMTDLLYLCEPTEYHEKRVTVHFTCDRGVSHELVRHRVFSFAQESTRYCNYSKDKFGNELTFILPLWLSDNSTEQLLFMNACKSAEGTYLDLLRGETITFVNDVPTQKTFAPWTPQQARAVLPNSLKTEVCMTGFMSDWKHFFKLRTAQAAHPQMRELSVPLQEMLKDS